MDHVLRYEADSDVKMIVVLGEVICVGIQSRAAHRTFCYFRLEVLRSTKFVMESKVAQ